MCGLVCTTATATGADCELFCPGLLSTAVYLRLCLLLASFDEGFLWKARPNCILALKHV